MLEAGFFDIIPRGAVGERVLQFTNRFTAYSSYAIELNVCGMIQDISPHNLAEPDFFDFFPEGAVGGAPLEIFQSIHSLQFSCD